MKIIITKFEKIHSKVHSFTVQSSLPLAKSLESGEIATECTVFLCPTNFLNTELSFISHMTIFLSSLPDTSSLPSGEKATEFTLLACSYSNSGLIVSFFSFQIKIEPSLYPEASTLQSGENAIDSGMLLFLF